MFSYGLHRTEFLVPPQRITDQRFPIIPKWTEPRRKSQTKEHPSLRTRVAQILAGRPELLLVNPVAVEKLAHSEFAKIGSRQEALQTIFPSLLDIFYHPIFDFFQKNRLFKQPPLFATSTGDFLGRSKPSAVVALGG